MKCVNAKGYLIFDVDQIKMVRNFGTHAEQVDSKTKHYHKSLLIRITWTGVVLSALSRGLLSTVPFFLITSLIKITAHFVDHQSLPPTTMFRVLALVSCVWLSIGMRVLMLSRVVLGVTQSRKMLQVLERSPTVSGQRKEKSLHGAVLELHLDAVDFSYSHMNGKLIFNKLTAKIWSEEKNTFFLVGPAGSGKTTLAHLLLRFYDPSVVRTMRVSNVSRKNGIFINGLNLKHLDPGFVRQQIGYIGSEVDLFDGSVMDNLLMGIDERPSLDVLVNMTKKVHLHEFIMAFPRNYETRVEDLELSDADKLLLALGRYAIRAPQLLILDEVLRHMQKKCLDRVLGQVERVIKQRNMNCLQTLVMANEPQDMQLLTLHPRADIFVLDHGRVAEKGQMDALCTSQGAFCRFYYN
ncbi:hypothetical protein Ciccas_007136 [Cichlidogyrus casuarinus]|uniref:ABC transporter domain-containing protein n=1 Tax=Cichlidogyrus casuarinus TaxID=1844966 RepID=A0ABD2Q3Q6_9PLAT